MATPEDLNANAEYIRLADQIEEVPGGSNNNNYANVDLIVEIAEKRHVDAVWAGWGHASENPKLPATLAGLFISVFFGVFFIDYFISVISFVFVFSFFFRVPISIHLFNCLMVFTLGCANDIRFVGPPASAMRDLGDKIASMILAQSANVRCVEWSGSGVTVDYRGSGISDAAYAKCCVNSYEEAKKAVSKIGYPLMIKASEGGGGKGIRKV